MLLMITKSDPFLGYQLRFPGIRQNNGNASEGAKRPSGGRVWEGGVPIPTPGSFCIFEIEIGRSGAHLGWIFWKKIE